MSKPTPLRPALAERGPRFALSIATLALVGFSLVLLVGELSMSAELLNRFLYENFLGIVLRRRLLLSLAAGAGILPVLALVLRARRGRAFELPIHRVAQVLAPLGIVFWVPVLFAWQPAQKNPLMYLVLLSAFVFVARPLLTRSFEEIQRVVEQYRVDKPPLTLRLPGWVFVVTVLLAAAAYAAYTAHFTIMNHRQVGTMAFDLGIYDNLMYNAMHGRFFHSPVLFGPGNRNYIAGHAELAMVLFVPFYAIRPSAETMLIMQSVMLGIAALPLYLFAARLIARPYALLLSFAYLLFAPLHGPHFYDFHWLPFAIFFHFWLYYSIVSRKKWLTALSIVLLLAIREDVAVGLALLGAFLFLTGIRLRLGMVLSVVASLWFVFDKFWLMPRMGAWWFENMYSELFAEGKASYGAVFATLITNPVYAVGSFVRGVKLAYGLHMVAPLAYLPLKRLVFLLLLIPGSAFTLMTTGYWPTTEISFQYTTHWIPYLFLAACLGLYLMRYELAANSKQAAAAVALGVAVLSHSYNFGAILQTENFRGGFSKITFSMSDEAKKRYEDLMSLIHRIPRTASVAATEAVNPHISSRLDAYTFRYDFGPVDYMLVSSREIAGDARKYFIDQLDKIPYKLVARAGEFFLFQRGDGTEATTRALEELGVASVLKRRHR